MYGIVKQAAGHVFVYSEVGQGSTFKIYWPRTGKESVPVVVDEIEKMRDLGGDETILVAEDEQITREMLTLVLRDKGYNVLSAQDGREAVAMAGSFQGTISL